MHTINDLTSDQFKTLLDEYFAPPGKRTKMTEAEIKDLASRLNKKINVPLISETGEEKILIKIILQIDGFLYDNLPNELYDLIRDMDHGISDKEARRMIRRLTRIANEKIDIPYIPEIAEKVAIRFVIKLIVNAARKKFSLTNAENAISDEDLESED